MAKGGIQQKGKKGPSKHSREARRATSPSINTDKSLKDIRPPSESINHRPAVLAVQSGAGVTKKKGRKAILSSKARRRQARGMDRAEAIHDRTATKVQRSKSQAKNTQSRSKTWDEINKQIPGAKGNNMFASLKEQDEDDDFEDTDEEMDADEPLQPPETIAPTPVAPGSGNVDEDEIL